MKLIIDIPDYNLDDIQNGSIACGQILKAVKNGIPYEERPQGEWLFDKENSFTIDMFKCSICGYFGHTHFKFCPNCGADLRGDTE